MYETDKQTDRERERERDSRASRKISVEEAHRMGSGELHAGKFGEMRVKFAGL